MCIGIPMQIEQCSNARALCTDNKGQQHDIDIMLIGAQKPGTWVMTFLNTARETLSAEQAHYTLQALQALEKVRQGEDFDPLFADLITREPELPAFLRQPAATQTTPAPEFTHDLNAAEDS